MLQQKPSRAMQHVKGVIRLPRQVRCEIGLNAMKWGVSWQNVAREKGDTTGWTTKVRVVENEWK